MAAVAALFTSCSKDDTIGGPIRGKVTFEVSTPELATRYGEGITATTLQYAVYDMIEDTTNGKLVDTGEATLSNKTVNVSIDLVEGRKYTAIFWADAGEDSPYEFNADTKTVSYKNINALEANQEAYDAFFAFVPQNEINVGETVTVELKRPFAQLRIETSDTERAKKLGVEVVKTGITVNAYTSFNLVTGDVDDKKNITFKPTTKASANTTVTNPDNTTTTYDLISMNYLLVNNSEMVDVTLNFTDNVNGTEQNYVRKYTAISVQRNYRTLVRGTILTDPTNFNVTVKQDFDSDLNADVNDENNKAVGVSNVDELQKALDAATDDTTIYFTQDITSDKAVKVTDKNNIKITIDGMNHKFDSAFMIHGNSAEEVNAGITIKNIYFESSTATFENDYNQKVDAFIWSNNSANGSYWRYANGVTIENCTFTATASSAAEKLIVGVKFQQADNIKVVKCTANNLHSLLQAESCDSTVTVEDCKVVNGKNGVSFNNTMNAVIKRTKIVAVGTGSYGVRHKGQINNYALSVEDCDITAFVPVLIRDMTAKSGYTATLSGGNTLNLNGSNIYHVVLNNGDFDAEKPLVSPTGSYTLTGADEFKVYPTNAEELTVTSAAGLQNVLSNTEASEVMISQDIDNGEAAFLISKDLDIDAQGNKVTAGGNNSKNYGFRVTNGASVNFSNTNILGGESQ